MAVLDVEDSLGRYDGLITLDAYSIKRVAAFSKHNIVAAWKFLLPCRNGSMPEAFVGVDDLFPYSWPVFSVSQDFVLHVPHIERTGKVCVSSEQHRFQTDAPGALVLSELQSITELLARAPEDHGAAFQREFGSYLLIHALRLIDPVRVTIISTLNLADQTVREIRLLIPADKKWPPLLCENLNQGQQWYSTAKGASPGTNSQVVPLVFLPHALLPIEYPNTGLDLLNILKSYLSQSAFDLVQSKIIQSGKHCDIAIVFITPTGPFLTLWRMRNDKTLHDPRSSKLSKYMGRLERIAFVKRVDPEWLVHRGGMGREITLRDKVVGVIGCGSLGGYVVEQLVKSGVREIHLIDPDSMDWDNAGRHILGGSFSNRPKPSSLKEFLERQFPSCGLHAHDNMSFFRFLKDKNDIAGRCDLFVVLTGEDTLMRQINLVVQRYPSRPPVVYGWTEEYGLAGHAEFVSGSKGCLQCTRDKFFKTVDPVLSWDEGAFGVNDLPGCGDSFASFGTAEVMPITGMITGLALDVLMGRTKESEHRIWIGRRTLLEEAPGAHWAESFEERYGDVGEGGKTISVRIIQREGCEACDAD